MKKDEWTFKREKQQKTSLPFINVAPVMFKYPLIVTLAVPMTVRVPLPCILEPWSSV